MIEASEKISGSKVAADVLGATRLNLIGLGLTLVGLQASQIAGAQHQAYQKHACREIIQPVFSHQLFILTTIISSGCLKAGS